MRFIDYVTQRGANGVRWWVRSVNPANPNIRYDAVGNIPTARLAEEIHGALMNVQRQVLAWNGIGVVDHDITCDGTVVFDRGVVVGYVKREGERWDFMPVKREWMSVSLMGAIAVHMACMTP